MGRRVARLEEPAGQGANDPARRDLEPRRRQRRRSPDLRVGRGAEGGVVRWPAALPAAQAHFNCRNPLPREDDASVREYRGDLPGCLTALRLSTVAQTDSNDRGQLLVLRHSRPACSEFASCRVFATISRLPRGTSELNRIAEAKLMVRKNGQRLPVFVYGSPVDRQAKIPNPTPSVAV